MVTKGFAKDLRRAQRALVLEVRAACLSCIEAGALCQECEKYVLGMICRPAEYIEMPGGRMKLPMPACAGGTRRRT